MPIKLPRILVSAALAAAVSLSAAHSRADEATSRWIAALPLGVGQIHRGDIGLGIFFAVSEALLGGTSIAAATWMQGLTSGALATRGPAQHVDVRALNDRLRTTATVNRLAFAGWAALTAAGVMEAEVNLGRRGSESRGRPSHAVGIDAAPVPGGASIGVHFSF